jgi:hypothetical protein
MLERARIGVDIGRVIMAATGPNGRADTSFLEGDDAAAMRTPPCDGAFAVIQQLVAAARGNVWLVSKAGPRIQALTCRWLAHWRFFEQTALPATQVRFCRERRDKATHATALQLSHFIDDRVDVLHHLRGVVPALYLFGHQRSTSLPGWATHVLTWEDVRRVLLAADEPGPVRAREPRDSSQARGR